MTTPDEHLKVLRELAENDEKAVRLFHTDYELAGLVEIHRKRAAALRWILEQNAYGVTDSEIVG